MTWANFLLGERPANSAGAWVFLAYFGMSPTSAQRPRRYVAGRRRVHSSIDSSAIASSRSAPSYFARRGCQNASTLGAVSRGTETLRELGPAGGRVGTHRPGERVEVRHEEVVRGAARRHQVAMRTRRCSRPRAHRTTDRASARARGPPSARSSNVRSASSRLARTSRSDVALAAARNASKSAASPATRRGDEHDVDQQRRRSPHGRRSMRARAGAPRPRAPGLRARRSGPVSTGA